MVELKRRQIELEGRTVHILEAGQGPAVLFVHGWPTHAQLWRHVLVAVAGAGRRAIALDLPGFGWSSREADDSFTFEFYAQIFDQLLAALAVEQLGLCVHDAGGPIALRWAVDRADRIDQLCLLNTIVFPSSSLAVKAVFWSAKLPGAEQLMGSPFSIRQTMRVGIRSRRAAAPVLALYEAPYRDVRARQDFVKAVNALDLSQLGAIEAGLARFASKPVRLIYGSRDHILPDVAQTMQRLKDQYWPEAELTRLEGVGHFLQEDSPEEVAALVARFFALS